MCKGREQLSLLVVSTVSEVFLKFHTKKTNNQSFPVMHCFIFRDLHEQTKMSVEILAHSSRKGK